MKILITTLFTLFHFQYVFAKEYRCGMSEGYAPFQYLDKGKPAGIDAKLVALFNRSGPLKVKVHTGKWDNLMSELYHLNDIDCLIGMEKTRGREGLFKFSDTVYRRDSSLVVLENGPFKSLKSLKGELVCGDKHSKLEQELIALEISLRITYLDTKEDCMKAMTKGEVVGAIMPLKVAFYFADKLKTKIKIIHKEVGSVDVGFAFKKKFSPDLIKFNAQLSKVKKMKEFEGILKSTSEAATKKSSE